jgi:hypothetical protein
MVTSILSHLLAHARIMSVVEEEGVNLAPTNDPDMLVGANAIRCCGRASDQAAGAAGSPMWREARQAVA